MRPRTWVYKSSSGLGLCCLPRFKVRLDDCWTGNDHIQSYNKEFNGILISPPNSLGTSNSVRGAASISVDDENNHCLHLLVMVAETDNKLFAV